MEIEYMLSNRLIKNNHHVFKFKDFKFVLLVQCNFSLCIIVITVRIIFLRAILQYGTFNINAQQLNLYTVVRVNVQGRRGVVELVAIANHNKINHCIIR